TSAEVESEDVLDRLPAHDLACPVGRHGHHARSGYQIVLTGHGPAIGPGRRHGEQVTGADVAVQLHLVHHDIAALAMFAHHAGEHRFGRGGAGDQGSVVVGAVQGGSDVVAHSAVDRNVPPGAPVLQGDGLDGAYPV